MRRASERGRLVIEIDEVRTSTGSAWRATLSMPGRESTFTRTFGDPSRVIQQAEYSALLSWLEVTVSNLLLLADGVQEPLEQA